MLIHLNDIFESWEDKNDDENHKNDDNSQHGPLTDEAS